MSVYGSTTRSVELECPNEQCEEMIEFEVEVGWDHGVGVGLHVVDVSGPTPSRCDSCAAEVGEEMEKDAGEVALNDVHRGF